MTFFLNYFFNYMRKINYKKIKFNLKKTINQTRKSGQPEILSQTRKPY
jgi:hypothetical protein